MKIPYNRTTVECKYLKHSTALIITVSYNRTTVECKCVYTSLYGT